MCGYIPALANVRQEAEEWKMPILAEHVGWMLSLGTASDEGIIVIGEHEVE